LTYTHRVPSFGSLTEKSPRLMEDFFGWGKGEHSGTSFREENCEGKIGEDETSCRPCDKGKGQYRLVSVPHEFTFAPWSPGVPERMAQFLATHNSSFTIFEMDKSVCMTSPLYSQFGLSRDWFRHKYWSRHRLSPDDLLGQAQHLFGRQEPSDQRDKNMLFSADVGDAPLNFCNNELTIAVHVRRGDFLVDKGRVLLKSAVYARLIRTAQDVVEEAGGPFADLPAAVYVYSEGKPKAGVSDASFLTHTLDRLSAEYVDEAGTVRDVAWWNDLISQTAPQAAGRPATRAGARVRQPRVELRISLPTVQTLHQMIRSDVSCFRTRALQSAATASRLCGCAR
jgi:hypothetical protein